MPLIRVEAGAASAAAVPATAIVAAYFADRLGFAIAPFPILALSLACALAVFVALRRQATTDIGPLAAFTAIVAGTFA
ncbi:MAG: hypothetical protein JWL71_4060, partial [Acidobacteria bacterium]|nr:hypothetical protein [Acidobacteriota bacterium]